MTWAVAGYGPAPLKPTPRPGIQVVSAMVRNQRG
jgi:hypothetical protein